MTEPKGTEAQEGATSVDAGNAAKKKPAARRSAKPATAKIEPPTADNAAGAEKPESTGNSAAARKPAAKKASAKKTDRAAAPAKTKTSEDSVQNKNAAVSSLGTADAEAATPRGRTARTGAAGKTAASSNAAADTSSSRNAIATSAKSPGDKKIGTGTAKAERPQSETAPSQEAGASQDAAPAPEATAATASAGKKAAPRSRAAAKGASSRTEGRSEGRIEAKAASSANSGTAPAVAEATGVQAAPDTESSIDEGTREKGTSRRTGRGRSSGRGRKSAAAVVHDAAAEGPSAAMASETKREAAAKAEVPQERNIPAMDAPADFPSGFDDAAPEDFFTDDNLEEQEAASGEGMAEPSEKKRRGRSRRGRGRKKATAQTTLAAGQADEAGDEDASVAPAIVEDFDDVVEDDDDDERPAARGGADAADARAAAKAAARRKMFVSVLPEEQIEVVITEEGQVQEYYVEMLHQAKTKGNIYKGIVHNVDPNLQAAFVSYGAVKNGFLQIDEVHPEYYVSPHDAVKGRKYPPIQKVLKAGQDLLVQIVKEPAGTKGAFLTTYLSMPGRFLVLTPGREQIGVSRKVESETERARLRELLEGLSPGPGLGVIVRTVSMGASKTSLQRDLQYLKRTWKDVRTRGTTDKAPCLIYQEMDLTSRAVRDYLTESVGEVWIDDEATAAAVSEIADALFPRKQSLVRVHKDTGTTLFERFNIQRQLDQIQSREVVLPSGGRLVIDPTEALTAIDINSGRSGGKNNFEDMAFRTNMEAAKMIPLQLRLRDIGGQVVADFIEMRDKSHWREVEKTLRNGMKVDRARYDVGKIGPFGMLEIVRQRLGSSAISISTEPCPCCSGTGVRRNMEWQSQQSLRDIMRLLRNAQAQNESSVVSYSAEQPLAMHLLNNKRQRLLEMEQQFGVQISIQIKPQEFV